MLAAQQSHLQQAGVTAVDGPACKACLLHVLNRTGGVTMVVQPMPDLKLTVISPMSLGQWHYKRCTIQLLLVSKSDAHPHFMQMPMQVQPQVLCTHTVSLTGLRPPCTATTALSTVCRSVYTPLCIDEQVSPATHAAVHLENSAQP